jgi:hypothetical protein
MTPKKIAEVRNSAGFSIPLIKEGQKVKGTVLKKISNGVLLIVQIVLLQELFFQKK